MTKNNIATCENIHLMTIDLSNQQAFNSDAKALQQINLTGSLEQAGNKKMLFIIDEVNEFCKIISALL